jgi:phosphoribosyl 1,2-cyclic phosphodiesterase
VSEIRFQIWGCRGGRNTHGSRIGNLTSCYSLRVGADLFVFDAGRGLLVLADAVLDATGGSAPRPAGRARGVPTPRRPAALVDHEQLRGVARVHVLVTHAHMDHWEGLKDAAWLWRPRNGIELTVIAPAEALEAIRRAHEPPSFVALDVLALNTLARLTFVELAAGARLALPGAALQAVALHHYSGMAPHQRHLDTLGYHLVVDGGPAVAYLSDHEPTTATQAMERELLAASQLAVIDANYAAIADHAFGHGSVEYAAVLAGRHPSTWILAAHHGPMRTDDAIEDAHRRYGGAHANLTIAVEGAVIAWDAAAARFVG